MNKFSNRIFGLRNNNIRKWNLTLFKIFSNQLFFYRGQEILLKIKEKQMNFQIQLKWCRKENAIKPRTVFNFHLLTTITWYRFRYYTRLIAPAAFAPIPITEDWSKLWMSNIIWRCWCLSALWQRRKKGRRRRRGWAAKMQLAKNANVNQREIMGDQNTSSYPPGS